MYLYLQIILFSISEKLHSIVDDRYYNQEYDVAGHVYVK